jgi:excisionase family DNA binding protein
LPSIEPDDRQTYGVKEAAELLHTSSKKVYQMCLAGKLRCVRIGGRIRIPIEEIEHCEAAVSTALIPRGPR